MAFNWTGKEWDKGGKGSFGRADYFEALKKGGTTSKQLVQTRKDIVDWMKKSTSAQYLNKPGMKIKDWVSTGTDIGSTMYGSGGSAADATTYGKADYYADLAQGRTSTDVRKHFTDNLANISKLGPNVFKEINTRADDFIESQATKGEDDRVKETKDASAATIAGLTTKNVGLQGDLTKMTGDLTSARSALGTEQSRFKHMQGEYKSDLAALKAEKLASRTNAPVAVGGDNALSIRQATGPKYRTSLRSLTRGTGPAASTKLKSTAINI